jgi:hypothetical protein
LKSNVTEFESSVKTTLCPDNFLRFNADVNALFFESETNAGCRVSVSQTTFTPLASEKAGVNVAVILSS